MAEHLKNNFIRTIFGSQILKIYVRCKNFSKAVYTEGNKTYI